MSVREANKNLRRRAILDAARALILEDKSRDFSMPALAERAGVSLATPYNLFGTKADILLEIVREDIFERQSDLDDLACEDLADWIAAVAQTLSRVFYSKRHFYRRMIVTLTASESPETQMASAAFGYAMYEKPLARLQANKLLMDSAPPSILAQHISHCISGSLQRRLMERGGEDILRRDIEMALLLILAGVCRPKDRALLHERMSELARDSQLAD